MKATFGPRWQTLRSHRSPDGPGGFCSCAVDTREAVVRVTRWFPTKTHPGMWKRTTREYWTTEASIRRTLRVLNSMHRGGVR